MAKPKSSMLSIPANSVLLFCVTLIIVGALGIGLLGAPEARKAGSLEGLSIVLTADGEGHIDPCAHCPAGIGLGGMARRATLISRLRKEGPLLLVDAGNALNGGDSAPSEGKVIAAAYDALAYDAVNLCYRDFRLGKAKTLEAFRGAKFPVISANLLDDATGKPLATPYVVRPFGARKIGILGVTEAPAGLEFLPHLQDQLAGLRIELPVEALAKWIPKAKAESDLIILLYYGTPSGLRPLRDRFGADLAAILVGGIRPDHLVGAEAPVIVAAEEHGKSLARVDWDAHQARAVSQIAVEPSVPVDSQMTRLLASFEPPAFARPAVATTTTVLPAATTAAIGHTVATTAKVVIAPAANVAATAPANPSNATQTTRQPDARKRVAVHPPLVPKGLAGVNLTAEQVNAAIDKGRAFLWTHIQAEHAKRRVTTLVDDGPDLLSALALVHAGAHEKVPEFDAQLRRYLAEFNPRLRQLATYECGLFCLLIEAYGDPVYLPKLRDTARYLVEMQGAGGTWAYGHTLPPSIYGELHDGKALQVLGGTPLDGPKPGVEELARISPWLKDTDGDNSVSQFALLGLRSASRWNLTASPDTWRRNLAAYRDRQCTDGGWDYEKNGAIGYGSMTCAGICGVAIDRHELGEKDPVADEAIERGLAWLDTNFSVTSNPRRGGGYLFYYLYSLERVGRILDTEFIGSHEWYPLGARFLVDSQKPSGKWVEALEDEDPRLPTSFALLFLTRSTQTLAPDVARNGSGELRTSLASVPPGRLYVILDASGSMLEEMDGRMKFDLARDAVSAMVGLLGPRAQVALRVYGHRKRSIEQGADEDTELLIPMGEYDAPKCAAALKTLRCRGKTPLALSLTQAAQDLASSREPTTVVLLTDGGEDTVPRRDPVQAAADFGKLLGLTFHIIGFDVNQEDWNAQLREMAARANGQYWPAPKGQDLERVLRAALLGDPESFSVLDPSGKEVHRGPFGQPKRLPEGKYDLVTQFAGREFRQMFWINTNGVTAVTFDASQAASDRTATIPASLVSTTQPATQPASPLVRRFCTHCGKPLQPDVKFCTECGAKVE